MRQITKATGGRSYVLAALMALTLMLPVLGGTIGPAEADTTPDAVAQALKSRIWWENLGSFGSQTWGYVHIFGLNQRADGWYTGTRVSYKGTYGDPPLGFAWKPFVQQGYSGVIIDRGYSRETFFFTKFDSQHELLSWQAYSSSWRSGQWSSTRSPLTPTVIRNLYYR